MSNSENLDEALVDERIKCIIDKQDLLILDDLHHHNRGHPRGEKVVVSTSGKQFAVADHDFTKFSIIPSLM